MNERTLLITKSCIQIQLGLSVWDDVRDDVATLKVDFIGALTDDLFVDAILIKE